MKQLSVLHVLTWFSFLVVGSALAQPQVIDLPEEPPAQRQETLAELWRIGGEDDEDILLGVINAGVLDQDGNIYLLDTQLSQVLVINSEGELKGTLGREGDGPGELSRPIGLFLKGADQLGIVQSFPGRMVLLNLDDTPADVIKVGGEVQDGGMAFMTQAVWRQENLVVSSGKGSFDMATGKIKTTLSLSLVDDQGVEKTRFVEFKQERNMQVQVFDEAADFSELRTWALGSDALYTVPQRADYLIHQKNMAGELTRVLKRPYRARKRSTEDKEKLNSTMKKAFQGRLEIEEHILDDDAAIATLNVAADGRLFVQHSFQVANVLPQDIAARYDIIDTDGVFVEELTLEVPGFNPKQDHLVFLDGNHFLHLRNIMGSVEGMISGLLGPNGSSDESEEIEALEIVFYRIPE